MGIRDNMDSVTDEMQKAAGLTEMAYQSALSVSAPDITTNRDSQATLEYILQMLITYFPEFEKNRGADAEDMYNLINRQMGMAVL